MITKKKVFIVALGAFFGHISSATANINPLYSFSHKDKEYDVYNARNLRGTNVNALQATFGLGLGLVNIGCLQKNKQNKQTIASLMTEQQPREVLKIMRMCRVGNNAGSAIAAVGLSISAYLFAASGRDYYAADNILKNRITGSLETQLRDVALHIPNDIYVEKALPSHEERLSA